MHPVFEELVSLSLPGPDHRGLLLMLAAYFDNSGTHDKFSVVTWGGFIATFEAWKRFDVLWRAELAKPLGYKPALKKFSLSRCQAKQEEFADYIEAESDHLQYRMREIIVSVPLLGMAYATDRKTWDRLVTGAPRDYFGDAETTCFSACINGSIARARRYWPNERYLSLHFDWGRKSTKLDGLVARVHEGYKGQPELTNIAFDVVEFVTPLQAADVLATENYWHALGVLNGNPNPRPHLEHFLKNASTEGYILDEPQILRTFADNGFEPPILSLSSYGSKP